MYKYKTLTGALTALSILTAGAGAAFAQTTASCQNNPFTTGCAGVLEGSLRAAQDRYCGLWVNRNNQMCKPTGAAWAARYPNAPSSPSTPLRSEFLKGQSDRLNFSGTTIRSSSWLRLSHAKFNNAVLGGDSTDGAGFYYHEVATRNNRYYAAIFSDTDLGRPLSHTTRKANWVGQFQSLFHGVSEDFVLEVDYGQRKIAAFVYYLSNVAYNVKGDFNNSGIIDGTVNMDRFSNGNRDRRTSSYRTGILTGLIGRKGAVGVFIANQDHGFSGGFVAREATVAHEDYLTDTCTKNPFNAFCYVNYSEQRAERATFCDIATNSDDTKCKDNGVVDGLCRYDPFNRICGGATYDSARTEHVKFCSNTADINDPACNKARRHVTADHWLAGAWQYATPNTNQNNQFLAGTATGLNTGDLEILESASLNLASATFNGKALGGDSSDGVAFARGTSASRTHFMAGILSGTNLGAPVTDRTGTVNWNGHFQSIFNRAKTDFVLEINFDVKTVEAFVKYPLGNFNYHLKGTVDRNGVISGTVVLGQFASNNRANTPYNTSAGALTGLIGAEGAVGAFANTGQYTYAGGFVARPDAAADYTAWVSGITDTLARMPNTSDTRNLFLESTATELNTGNIEARNSGSLKLADTSDGVAFFKGTNNRFYAGVLSGTNLGAPLTETAGTANWNGTFQVMHHSSLSAKQTFTLKITFGGSNKAGSIEALIDPVGGTYPFYLTGDFDNKGVINGTVAHRTYTNNNPTLPVSPDVPGTLNGLIGQQGAVGAFIANGTEHYSGGFVARPPGQ